MIIEMLLWDVFVIWAAKYIFLVLIGILSEAIPMSTHKIHFDAEITKKKMCIYILKTLLIWTHVIPSSPDEAFSSTEK